MIAGRLGGGCGALFGAMPRAVDDIVRRWASPFCDGWEHWRPDEWWPIPELPADAIWDFDGLTNLAT